MKRYIPPTLNVPHPINGGGLFHMAFNAEEQAQRVRQLINARFSEEQVASLTGWSIEQIRRACSTA
jgi:hypothetical protein